MRGFAERYTPEQPKELPPEMIVYQWFAEAYSWSPRQVDELSLEEIFWLPVLRGAMREAQEKYSDSQN